jgi:molybdate transport system ATP-binding protein
VAATVTPRTLEAHVRRHVVDAVLSLPLDGPPVTALFGPSGSGKTTVLRALAGLDRAGGAVRFGGEVWDDGRTFVPPRRRGVGYLVQEHALFPHLDVDANVGYGLRSLRSTQRGARVAEALAATGATHLAGRRVPELSGGEAQRVALARALAPRPRLLLLDEPLSALDAPTRARLRADLRQVLVAEAVPTVVVTHDRAEALALADRVVVLVGGVVRQTGTPQEVFDRPADPDVVRVVGVETAVPGRVVRDDDGLLTVTVADRVLTSAALPGSAPPVPAPDDDVLVCIRAEDVALAAPDATAGGSPRNRLAARVTGLAVEGALVRVDLDAGFALSAYVTRPALDELDLRLGAAVTAVVKSPAVHLVRRSA